MSPNFTSTNLSMPDECAGAMYGGGTTYLRSTGIAAEGTAAVLVEDVANGADDAEKTLSLLDVDLNAVVAAGRTAVAAGGRLLRAVASALRDIDDGEVSGSGDGDGGHGKSEDCGELHGE